MNTGTDSSPFAVKRSESGLGRRGAIAPLSQAPTSQGKNWMCEISIGTPPQTLNVQIDTGSADMWVLQDGCKGISMDHDLWDPHLSDTSEYEGKSFRLKYGDGTIVAGDQYTDGVTLAGFTTEFQTFGSASSYTGPQNNKGSDGLIGLAFPSASKFGADPLFESLIRGSTQLSPTFSLKLAPSGAEMYVGGTNSMLYKGDIAYTRVINAGGLWQVSVDDIRVNGRKVLENVPAVFDTGASYIFGDWNRVSELYQGLRATLYEHGGFGYYGIPCDSFPTVSFTFGGTTFEIPPQALRLPVMMEGSSDCFSAIVAERSPSTEYWSIGISFMQGVYTVFEYRNLQIGFAELA